jgi:hypothetical protein
MVASENVVTDLMIRGLVFDAPRLMGCGVRQRLTRPLHPLAMLVTAGCSVRSVPMSGGGSSVAVSICVRTAANSRNYKMRTRSASKSAAGESGITFLFDAGRACPALPEQNR